MLEDDFGPIVLGERQRFNGRHLVAFLQGRLYMGRHPERVNANEKATVVKDMERLGRDIGGQSSSELIGQVNHQSGRGTSALLWIFDEGGSS